MSSFRQHGESALPAFQAILNRHGSDIDRNLSIHIVPALLQASKLSTQQWKQDAISWVEYIGVGHLPTHVKAYFAYRKSLILRTNRRETDAEQAIRTYYAENPTQIDQRLNAIHGYLKISLGWLAIEKGDFEKAVELTANWKALANHPSLYEVRVAVRLCTLRGIIMYHQRDYYAALTMFKSAIGLYDPISRARQIVIAKAMDTYCELEQYEKAHELSFAELKRSNVKPTELTRAHFEDHYLREVLISNAELKVRLKEQQQALDVLQPLMQCFDSQPVVLKVDQQRHIRVLILYAQNLHQNATTIPQWNAARDAWSQVVRTAETYTVLDLNGWDLGLVFISIHHTHQNLSLEGDEELYKRGIANLEGQDHFWMCGMQTHWLHYILEHVEDIPSTSRTKLSIQRSIVARHEPRPDLVAES